MPVGREVCHPGPDFRTLLMRGYAQCAPLRVYVVDHEVLGWLWCPVTQGILKKFYCFLLLSLVPLSHISEHVFVSLDENLRIMLPMQQLFISISLHPSQEIDHESLLLFSIDAFLLFKPLQYFILMSLSFQLL